MSLFKNKANNDDVVQEKDSLGMSRLFESGLVDFTIESAFIGFTDKGSMSFTGHLKRC